MIKEGCDNIIIKKHKKQSKDQISTHEKVIDEEFINVIHEMKQGNVKRLEIICLDFQLSESGISSGEAKEISSFLSQDGIVLEELDLSLKKVLNFNFKTSIEDGRFVDEVCVHLVEGLKKNKSLKKVNLASISSNSTSFLTTLRL